MHPDKLRALISSVAKGNKTVEQAMSELKSLPYEDLGFAKLDHHRHLRRGFPEVVFCEGKTTEQIVAIVGAMVERESNVLATRVSPEVYEAVRAEHKKAVYSEDARTMTILAQPIGRRRGSVTIISAGTSDIMKVIIARWALS